MQDKNGRAIHMLKDGYDFEKRHWKASSK